MFSAKRHSEKQALNLTVRGSDGDPPVIPPDPEERLEKLLKATQLFLLCLT